ncbi:MAG: SPOR domain-containing protein [Hahellaceae bacterium]|nr:SPOR domain-containing protein [Hahellaceae bacterium]
MYHLRSIPAAAPVTSANAGKPEKSIKAAPKETTKQSTTATTPRFTFYNDLPKREIETSGANPYSPKGSDGVQYDYLLQAGSFRRYEDAHRQMGMIAMQGLKPYITESTSNDHGTWYRVMLGPYSSRSKMNSATDRLVSMSIQPLPKKIPREE